MQGFLYKITKTIFIGHHLPICWLISDSKNTGFVFITLNIIVVHFVKIQNIRLKGILMQTAADALNAPFKISFIFYCQALLLHHCLTAGL